MRAARVFKKILVAGAAAIALASCRLDVPAVAGTTSAQPRWVTGVVSDFITGGGWFDVAIGYGTDIGSHANFGWHGGVKNGDWWGQGNYIDHGLGLHVKTASVTGYERLGQDTTDAHGHPNGSRQICGEADTDLYGRVTYLVMMTDKGEPGRQDKFGIALYYPDWSVPFYAVMGSLGDPTPGGGNIQLHLGNKSNTPPSAPAECRANPFPEG